jgi:2-oxoglutaroyl-CoA hydrolase
MGYCNRLRRRRRARSGDHKLVDELRTFSRRLRTHSQEAPDDTEDATLSIAIELEGHCYSRLRQSDDFREGVEAFHAKRPAKFRGS